MTAVDGAATAAVTVDWRTTPEPVCAACVAGQQHLMARFGYMLTVGGADAAAADAAAADAAAAPVRCGICRTVAAAAGVIRWAGER